MIVVFALVLAARLRAWQRRARTSRRRSHPAQAPRGSRSARAPYRTTIRRDGAASTLTVTGGKQTIRAPLLWPFGLGAAGQIYVLEHAGALYESRLSYYQAIGGLDLTMGAHGTTPATIEQAAGRLMDAADVRECFGCHSSGGVRDGNVDPASLQPGVSCVNCHAVPPGHGMKGGGAPKPPSLKRLGAEEMSDLCGSCHRTWSQVAAMGLVGVANVRFQPYRIANSKCYDADDRRIGCTACHDPQRTIGDAPGSLRRQMRRLPRRCGRRAGGKSEAVPGREARLRHLPHAQIRAPRSALPLHRPPNPNRPPRRALPELTAPAHSPRLVSAPSVAVSSEMEMHFAHFAVKHNFLNTNHLAPVMYDCDINALHSSVKSKGAIGMDRYVTAVLAKSSDERDPRQLTPSLLFQRNCTASKHTRAAGIQR